MKTDRSASRPAVALVAAVLAAGANPARAEDKKEYGVYEYVVRSAQGGLPAVSAALEAAAAPAGWRVLATLDSGAPQGCPYKARVLVLYQGEYAGRVVSANRKTGPFAAVDRINIFEDEEGVHVAVVNPHSVNRTVLMDDHSHQALSQAHLVALRAVITGAVQGQVTQRSFGEKRDQGYIGKTMGVMAGGPFDGKIQDVAVVGGADWRSVAAGVREGLKRKGAQWGMQLAYELELPEQETAIFGSTGTPMDAKSFSIVGAGGDDARRSLKCPGLAHAASFPIEVVVAREGGGVNVRLVQVMYRMKMYFEDAGKWAFMKNMGMPGSIQDELEGQVRAGLGPAKP